MILSVLFKLRDFFGKLAPLFKVGTSFISSGIGAYSSYGPRTRAPSRRDIRCPSSSPNVVLRRGLITSFFFKADLKIIYDPQARPYEHIRQTSDRRWGETIVETRQFGQPRQYPERRFINIIVENKGKLPAINCEARLKLLTKIDGCYALSPEEKLLAWEDGETKATIGARHGREFFHLAFSQRYLSYDQLQLIDPVYCGVVKNKIKFVGWAGTQKALESPEYRDQDGLCQGNFKVHVEVATEDGHRESTDFIIKVGDAWEKLEAEMLECKCQDP